MGDVEMEDNEKMEEKLENDGQPLENNFVNSEINHQQEENSAASIQDDKNPENASVSIQDHREIMSGDDKTKENEGVNDLNENQQDPDTLKIETEDKIPEKNGDDNQNLLNNEQREEPVKNEIGVVEEGQSGHLPDDPENEQDDSEKTEVAEYENDGINDLNENQEDPATPTSLTRCSNAKADDERKEIPNNWLLSEVMEDDEDGSIEEQAAFMKELKCFYRERALEFKPPKFYQQPLNCLKLWRAVIKLGGYDLVTGTKLWRQIGESFHPPKTCTTVSWTFRIFYEKALLEYERYKTQNGDIQLSAAALPESSSVDNDANGYQGSGVSGRARRDAASRAMQGWHVQKLFSHGEIGEPAIKDKNFNNMPKREKSLKSIGSVKHKRPAEMDYAMKAARTEMGKQMVITVEDAGPPADWVKINVREAQDCFEVYALVPGLLREEVRVQSDPVGRLVITGQPEQPDNPWGITPFRKVVNLPARIDPLQTSAVVSLHGRLYVRVPFEESDM